MLENIKSLLSVDVPEDWVDLVVARLEGFGVLVVDDLTLAYSMTSTYLTIRNECNVYKVPDDLLTVYVDMCCGRYLLTQLNTGKLLLDGVTPSDVVKQLTEGDVSITYDENASDSAKLNKFIDYLIDKGKGEMLRFRRLTW